MIRFFALLLIAISFARAEEAAYLVKINDGAAIREISRFASLEKDSRKGFYRVYTDETNVERLFSFVSSFEKLEKKIPAAAKMITTREEFVTNWDGYPTWSVFMETINAFRESYPNLCRLDTIGYSTLGKPLIFINISGGSKTAPKPRVMYESTIHGNEMTGFVSTIRLTDLILKSYGAESVLGSRITRLVDSLDIWIMPLFNPDGTYPVSGDNALNSKRTNKNGKDLNRDFPEQFTDPVNTTTGRQAETAAMMNFVFGKRFTLSANFHDGTAVVNYPWDALPDGSYAGTESICPDDEWYKRLSAIYASTNEDMLNSTEFEGGITNGSAWYTVYGCRQDWIYAFEKCRETTIELCDNGILSPTELTRQWDINSESLIAYLEQALYGVHGYVTDDSGESPFPLSATIKVVSIPGADVVSDSSNQGYYARLLLPGVYDIIAEHYDCEPDTAKNVIVGEKGRVTVNFELKRKRNAVEESNFESISAFFRDDELILQGLPSDETQIEIFDVTGAKARIDKQIIYTGGVSIIKVDLPAGAYFVKVTFTNGGTRYLKVCKM